MTTKANPDSKVQKQKAKAEAKAAGKRKATEKLEKKFKVDTIFLIDGKPASADSADPFTIDRELVPGLHEIEIWRHGGRNVIVDEQLLLLCDEPGKDELVPCPEKMFDPASFPEGVRNSIPQPAAISSSA